MLVVGKAIRNVAFFIWYFWAIPEDDLRGVFGVINRLSTAQQCPKDRFFYV
jgi:hypothetical protein